MPLSPLQEPDNGRRTPRDRVPRVVCSLGQLADLSARGARIRTRRRPRSRAGDLIDITIGGPPTPPPRRARVVWVRRTGLLRYDIGIEFVTPDPSRSLPFPATPMPHARRTA